MLLFNNSLRMHILGATHGDAHLITGGGGGGFPQAAAALVHRLQRHTSQHQARPRRLLQDHGECVAFLLMYLHNTFNIDVCRRHVMTALALIVVHEIQVLDDAVTPILHA
jgi:hypothetical protein